MANHIITHGHGKVVAVNADVHVSVKRTLDASAGEDLDVKSTKQELLVE